MYDKKKCLKVKIKDFLEIFLVIVRNMFFYTLFLLLKDVIKGCIIKTIIIIITKSGRNYFEQCVIFLCEFKMYLCISFSFRNEILSLL